MIMTIKEKIKKWYNGDPGESHWEPIEEIRTVIRPPSHHWTARFLQWLVSLFKDSERRSILLAVLGVLTFIFSFLNFLSNGYTNQNSTQPKGENGEIVRAVKGKTEC